MDAEHSYPVIRQTVLDTTEPRPLAEFYRLLFGLHYRPGDEPPEAGQPDPRGEDWLVLRNPSGGPALAFQRVEKLPEPTWPDGPVSQQLHLDTSVPSVADLDIQHERALTLGARMLLDRSDDPEEPLRVYADPAGHPFCIFVAALPSASKRAPIASRRRGRVRRSIGSMEFDTNEVSCSAIPPPPSTALDRSAIPPPPSTAVSCSAIPPPPSTLLDCSAIPPPPSTAVSCTVIPPPPSTAEVCSPIPPPPALRPAAPTGRRGA